MSIEARFWKFHAENPHIYELIVLYAREAKRAGFINYGIGSIFERIRWHVNMETINHDGFKMSNDLRSRYARLVMRQEEDLKGFFRIRPLSSSSSTEKKRKAIA
jgi:hypothetical protein